MDLGIKHGGGEKTMPATADMPSTSYPSFTLNDKLAEEFLDDHPDISLEDELTVTMKIKLSSMRQDNYGAAVGFDCLSMEPQGEAKEGDAEDDKSDKDDGEKRKPRKNGDYNNPAVENLIESDNKR